MDYAEFLARKALRVEAVGFAAEKAQKQTTLFANEVTA